ncbi:MAG: aminodeoxychorismate/anthranilate synthase component II [Desulfobulbaceae bacterium]|jgi:anthranilate synthase/aminodeoxychorismate synthase-like glutamine amidotransferase|nr:aminodeoxychorismate/anthranilate synthase component II [Desulfobulbaceae bacterium]
MLLIIDNYDSFTYNIVQTVATFLLDSKRDEEILVVRNDTISLDEIANLAPRRLLISPGPCTPKEAGISVAVIARFAGIIPILGVCLGHQSVGEAFGGKTVPAARLMHGKTSSMHHDGRGVFTGLPNPFAGMRYHSLVTDEASLPACLEVTCRSENGELMGLRHRTLAVEGVQFHPESIMTPAGAGLLKNFMDPAYPDMLRR